MEIAENDESSKGQVEVWHQIYAFTNSMVLKCAVDSQGGPITLKQIASGITDSPSLNISYLERIMRLLSPQKHLHRSSSITRWRNFIRTHKVV